MKDKPDLNELDMQLYLAGAMPLFQRGIFLLAMAMDRDLRNRLRAVKAENLAFREREMHRLQRRLFPEARRSFQVTWGGKHSWNLAWGGSLALLALCALPLLHPDSLAPDSIHAGKQAFGHGAYIAKGRGLGVNLYVKGDSAYRVENQTANIAPTDTLQVLPTGSEPQHMALFGWDEQQGMVRLFPMEGAYSRQVAAGQPPPALLLQGLSENRLICITAMAPFRMDEIQRHLEGKPYAPIKLAPASHLEGGRYIQIFSISKKTRRI